MNSTIYGKLAFTNIKNNRKTYVPYMITAVLTVMMYYIMDALFRSKSVGDGVLSAVLWYAVWVIVIFAVIFLFYTNSFLIKRRKKEIAVYNILGMGKRHIAKMLTVETLVTAMVSLILGIAGGIIFSKLMYLALLRIIHYDISMSFEISVISVRNALILFTVIFALTLFYNLLQIQLASPVELLRGGTQGEKEPRTKWMMAVLGVIAIGVGYYIAVTTKQPIEAINAFFVAVVCVIVGTYALFTAGSIALLKLLRKNKTFYYKTSHFTSVSGMIYRMKQNAVGLANICILSTMVLIMISTTISLYVGMNDILENRFPQAYQTLIYDGTEENISLTDQIIKEETQKEGVELSGQINHRYASLMAVKDGEKLELKMEMMNNGCSLTVLPLEDYNRIEGKQMSLDAGEVLVYTTDEGVRIGDELQIGAETFRVKKRLKHMKTQETETSSIVEGYHIVVSDTDIAARLIQETYADSGTDEEGLADRAQLHYLNAFDLKGDKDACIRAGKAIHRQLAQTGLTVTYGSREESKEGFYTLYGGLLFIGIYLGAMFLMATVLIIYYKQISEGFDDKERYHIMQKVGMGKREVRHSIRSQVLTVFFLPLAAAIVHIAAAFHVVTKLLVMLNLTNVPLYLTCTVITVAVFAVFYAIVFAITAREYYKIVN